MNEHIAAEIVLLEAEREIDRLKAQLKNCTCKLTYLVECDFRPYQRWAVEAESESEARLMVAHTLGVPYEQTSASIEKLEEVK
jgi:hypothetical protein